MRAEGPKKYSKSQVTEALPPSFRELPGVAAQSPPGVRCSICGVFFPAGGQVSSFAFLVPDSSTGCLGSLEILYSQVATSVVLYVLTAVN